MGKRGGARPGAGRKPRSEKFATPIADGERRIADRLPWLIDKEFELATGVMVQEVTKDGKVIYQTPPDRQAIEYLINRVMGKPVERKEVSGPDGGAQTHKVYLASDDFNPDDA